MPALASNPNHARRHSARSRRRRSRLRLLVVCCTGEWVAAALGQSHPTAVPQLASRPGAAYTIYLDFGGFSFTGGWGSTGGSQPGVIPAYDSAVNGISTSDQSYIQQIWSGVADKYASFNVNVTTIDPAVTAGAASNDATRQASYDQTAQMMHTIIGDTSFTAAGVSFEGVDPYSYGTSGINGGAGPGYHTNFVTPTGTGGEFGIVGIVGTAAHENGHGLNLEHQSDYNGSTLVNEYSINNGASGNGSVSPIMGAIYYSQRGVWRSGTSDAGNGTLQQQNDVQVLASNPNMGGLENDGVGHTTATAALLPTVAGGIVNFAAAKGVITPISAASPNPIGAANYTTDLYAFNTTGGTVSLTLHNGGDRVLPGVTDATPTLASTLTILNSSGTVLYTASENFANQTETLSQSLAAGKYYVQINSAGGQTSTFDGSTNSYYDMGEYFLTGSGVTGTSVGNYYWQGGATTSKWSQVDNGTTTNWRNDHTTGADPGTTPGATDNVFLSVDSGATNLATITLGANRTVNSLTFTGTGSTAATSAVNLAADGNTLTLSPYSGHLDQTAGGSGTAGVGAGVGLVVQAGAASDTLAAKVYLALGQTWQMNNSTANPLSVTGAISGAPGAGLNLTGGGELILSGPNSYTGGTTVSGSLLSFASGALGSGQVTLNSGGTLQFAAGNIADLTTGNRLVAVTSGGGIIDTNSNAITLAGGIADAFAGSITKVGAGTLTMGGSSTPTNLFVRGGGMVLSSGANYSTANGGTGDQYVSIGQTTGDNGTLTVNGGATLTAAGDLNIGDATGSTGSINVLPSATVNVRTLYLGKSGTASGTIVQSGGVVQAAANGVASGAWVIGGATSASAAGTYSLLGGSLNDGAVNMQVGGYGTGNLIISGGTASVGGFLSIARYAGSIGTLDMSSGNGILNANTVSELLVGEQGTGTLKVGGMSVVNAQMLAVAQSDGTVATGTVLQSGGIVNATNGVVFGGQATGSTVVSANYTLGNGTAGSGILNTTAVSQGTAAGLTGNFHFNGGTIAALGSSTTFMQGLSGADVGAGGAAVDSAQYSITIAQPLLHASALGTADGGLTKLGSGTLTLAGASSYTGPTNVNVGTMVFARPGGGSPISGASTITIASGAALQLGNISGGNNNLGLGQIPAVTVAAGGLLTTVAGATNNLGALTLTGGTVAGSASPASGYGNYTLNSGLTASGAVDSTISALGGIGLRGTNTFTVGSGGGRLMVSSALNNEPGYTGGLIKAGSGMLVLNGASSFTGATTVSLGLLAVNGSLDPSSTVSIASTGALAGTGTIGGTVGVAGTITAGSGPTAADTVGILQTGVETWSGGQYDVKLDPTRSVTDSTQSGQSGAPGVANDKLVLSSVAADSTGLTVDPLYLSNSSLGSGIYSFVIADVTTNVTTFDSLIADDAVHVGTSPPGFSANLSEMSDGGGGQYLLLDVTNAPEPTSLGVLAAMLTPLPLRRRRRCAP